MIDTLFDSTLPFPRSPGVLFNAAWFVTPDVGWIVGTYNAIAKTTDGGAHWHLQHTVPGKLSDPLLSYWSLSDVCFVDTLHGWAVGRNHFTASLLRTTDGGGTWLGADSAGPAGADLSVAFIDSLHGWVNKHAAEGLWITGDGGVTWTRSTLPVPVRGYYDVQAIALVDTSEGWAVGEYEDGAGGYSGVILNTTDGGQHWSTFVYDSAGGFVSVSFPAHDIGFALGFSAVNDSGLVMKYTHPSEVHTTVSPVFPQSVEIYPNPATSNAVLALAGVSGGAVHVSIVDMLGRTVCAWSSVPVSDGEMRLPPCTLTAGLYLVRARGVTTTVSTRVVILP